MIWTSKQWPVQAFFSMFYLVDYMLSYHVGLTPLDTSRIIGLVHHIPTLYFCYVILMDHAFWANKMDHTTVTSHHLVDYAAAYFLYDVAQIMRNFIRQVNGIRPKQFLFFMHGFYCYQVFHYIHKLEKGHFFAAAFLTWEASTPFYYAMHYMKKNTTLYKINSILFALLFVTFRIGFGTYVVYGMAWPFLTWYWKAVGVCLTFLNYYWANLIFRNAKKTLTSTS